ncbi:MAG: ankyrin repeat domain-containing protein [Legionellaceae bacterium]
MQTSILDYSAPLEEITSIHGAIQTGCLSDILAFLEEGYPIDEIDEYGRNILNALFIEEVVLRDEPVTYEEIRTYAQGREKEFLYAGQEIYFEIIDEKQGFLEVVNLMLAHGVDPTLADVEGRTPLHWAAYYGFKDVTSALLYAGADPTVQDTHGETARDFAAGRDLDEMIQLLFEAEQAHEPASPGLRPQ